MLCSTRAIEVGRAAGEAGVAGGEYTLDRPLGAEITPSTGAVAPRGWEGCAAIGY